MLKVKRCDSFNEDLYNVTKVLPLDIVIGFNEDLSQDGFTDGIIFRVEFVKSMECVAVLQTENS